MEISKEGSAQMAAKNRVPKPDDSVYSPTCSTEALMETLGIYAMEQRDMAIFDVPGDFIQKHYQ